MRRSIGILLAVASLGACDGTDSQGSGDMARVPDPPPELADGLALFRTHCASCHGEGGAGTEQGPPLVHRIYEPSHHGDGAFQVAVARGARAHHWRFGDMQPVPGVAPEQVDRIIAYIRWLQRQAGIT